MRSSKQIEASRRNGSKSRGPRTPAGKSRSSMNARRHGMLSKLVITGDESEKGLKQVVTEHLLRFGSLDGVEFGMIEEMAVAFWRMRRIWTVEKRWMDKTIAAANPNVADIDAIADAFGKLADSNRYKVLQRYESRMHRIYQRSLKTLLTLQTKAEASQKIEANSKNEPNEPNPANLTPIRSTKPPL